MSSVSLGRGSSVERHGPSVLVVCMGNICRSPIAEGLLRHHARREGVDLYIDSAGTHAYHVGEPPDARARRVCRACPAACSSAAVRAWPGRNRAP